MTKKKWQKSQEIFKNIFYTLYKEEGTLIIEINQHGSGYKFDTEISKSTSGGYQKMAIFSYDLMLVQLMNEQNGIDFIVHDSIIFEGVDERQQATALHYAHKKGIENNFQYICVLNSDELPDTDFEEDFNIQDFVRLTLKDSTPKDSILGFYFELNDK